MDGWFEEDEEVFVHPHDPYSRIDILHSSRHVQVEVNGVTVADTHQPTLLFETGLPTRYYFPKLDVRLDLLTPTDTTSGCAYKGFARYWSVEAGGETFEDLAWSYRTPLPESVKIAGLVAFYNEKVDLVIDGERRSAHRPTSRRADARYSDPARGDAPLAASFELTVSGMVITQLVRSKSARRTTNVPPSVRALVACTTHRSP